MIRTSINLPLQPGRHLQPCLAFLSGRDEPFFHELDERTGRLIREKRLARGARDRRAVITASIGRLRERVRRSIAGRLVAKEFVDYASAKRLDQDCAFRAWGEVWHFLHWHSPGLHEWIGSCPWCGRLFARYHRRDIYCSTLCGLAAQLLKGAEAEVARDFEPFLVYLLETERQFEEQFGRLHERFKRHATHQRRLLLMAVLGRWGEPFKYPKDVTDPDAFCTVWEFLFGSFPELTKRPRICPECAQLYWRKDRRMQTCSRACQLRRYRQQARKQRKSALVRSGAGRRR